MTAELHGAPRPMMHTGNETEFSGNRKATDGYIEG